MSEEIPESPLMSETERLQSAEWSLVKVRQWLNLMADRGSESVLLARELCLVLGWAPPGPRSPMCALCGATGRVHNVHYGFSLAADRPVIPEHV